MRFFFLFVPLLLFSCQDTFEDPQSFKNQPASFQVGRGPKVQLIYGEKGVLLTERILTDNGNVVQGTYEYDSEGRLLRISASKTGGIDRKVTYRNGELSVIDEIQVDTFNNTEELLVRYNINKYEKGRVVEMTVENRMTGRKRAFEYEYLSNGNLLNVNEFGFDGHIKRSLQSYTRYTYKHRKNLLKGNYAFMTDVTSFYTRNLPLSQTVYSPKDEIIYQQDYEYEFESGKPVKMRAVGVDSSGADSIRVLRFTY